MTVQNMHAVTWHKTERGDHAPICHYHPNDWHNRRFGRRLRFVRFLMDRGEFSEGNGCPCRPEGGGCPCAEDERIAH